MDISFEEASERALKFRDDRDWKQFHNPKDLAISVSLEASELLECFQWSGTDLEATDAREHIEEELADVLIYCIYLADAEGIQIPQAICAKLHGNEARYPANKSRGNSKKYTEL